jgi:class 3 adenylate cyclase
VNRRTAALCSVAVLALELFACLAHAAPMRDAVTLSDATQPIPLGRHVQILRDDSGTLTLTDVQAQPLADRFVPSQAEIPSFGFITATQWYRVALRSPVDKVTDWILQESYGTLDYVDVYITRSNGSTQSFLTGDRRHPPATQLPHRTFAIPFELAPREQVTLYLRVKNGGSHVVPLAIWTPHAFQAKTERDNLWNGAFGGIVLIMVLYNLVILATVRDRAYLYYVLYIASTGTMVFILSGYARRFGNDLFESAPAMINACTPAVMNMVPLFGVLFFREFLQTRREVPYVHHVTSVLVAAALLVVVMTPVIPYTWGVKAVNVISAPSAIAGLAVGGYLSFKGVRAARLYMLAWTVVLIAVFLTVLRNLAVIPADFDPWLVLQIGVCLEATILSLALADRINTERQEKLAAREQARSANERANRLKSFLPQKVAELIGGGGDSSLLEPKRRQVTVCVIDLRGFTPFSETSTPEDVMNLLREFYATMGDVVEKHGGTVEHFAGDSMLIFFNAPLEIPNPEKEAVETALMMRAAIEKLLPRWQKLGHELGLGIGIANGYATIGAIGFLGRSQYAAIGAVTNLASRLCSIAKHGEILTTARVLAEVEGLVESESAGEQAIKGFSRPIQIIRVRGPRGPKPATDGESALAIA